MAKKKKSDEYVSPSYLPATPQSGGLESELPANIPEEAKKKLVELKGKLDQFQKKVLDKFSDYVLGISLLPPPRPEVDEQGNEQPVDKNKIYVLVLVDDADSTKMSKEELKNKLSGIMTGMAQEVDKNLAIETLLLTELWQSCYDAKYDYLQAIAMSAPVYDKGMLAAIKIAEVHKTMVLKKFEKYIVCYVLGGSLVQGKATSKSDIDVFIVIDDTDVKKMTRAELKDKLRAIIVGMGAQAGEMTGIQNKINIQVYILTDFWDNIKEANPVIFTFLRDGVPFYDRGIFMPWKQLLQMGRVKPSQESIEMFMHTGDQIMERVKFKLAEIATEDFFWATLTPTQAAIMLYGLPPPTPRETPEVLRDIFVKKEKLIEEDYVQILERILKVRKDIEHGDKKIVFGKEIDGLVEDSKRYLERLNKLFKQIEERKEEESILHNYETIITIVRDMLKFEGVDRVSDADLSKVFDTNIIQKGYIPERYSRLLKDIIQAKKSYESKKLGKADIHEINKNARECIKIFVEYIQRKRGRELERVKIRVKHGNTFGEVIILDKDVFIIHNIDNENKEITRATLTPQGTFTGLKESSLEELESVLAKVTIPEKTFIKETLFEHLKGIFGKDIEILINY